MLNVSVVRRVSAAVGRVVILGLVLAATGVRAIGQDAGVAGPYLRVVEDPEGNRLTLEAAVKEFKPDEGDGPVLHVAAAIHIGDLEFYKGLQQKLDGLDVVLFEGVKPPGLGGDAGLMDDEAKARATARRIRLVAMAVEAHQREHGSYPADVEALKAGSKLPGGMLERSLEDLWARPLVYTVDPAAGTYEIASLGADGAEGGEEAAKDLKLSDQKPLTKAERGAGGRGAGIQQQMADAMGLSFQLAVMDHSGPNWRNSDMSLDQVQQRLEEVGAGGDQLFKMLDGTSFLAKFLGVVLELVKASPTMQSTMKVMMVEMLSRADEVMAAQAGAKLMTVIVEERNEVVMADLRRILETEPGVKSIGVIYGAGHLADLEKRLAAETGYEPVSIEWRPAITVDLKATGMSPAQVKQVRDMIGRQLDAQLKRKGS